MQLHTSFAMTSFDEELELFVKLDSDAMEEYGPGLNVDVINKISI